MNRTTVATTPDITSTEAASAVRVLRGKVLDRMRAGGEHTTEPAIRVMVGLVRSLQAECEARGIDPAVVRDEIVDMTIGDVDVRKVVERDDRPGGYGDLRSLADELGVALPDEEVNGLRAVGEGYRWLTQECLRIERSLLDRGIDLRIYDIDSVGNPVLREWLAEDLVAWGADVGPANLAVGLGANDCLDKLFRGISHLARMGNHPPGAVLFPAPGFNMPMVQARDFGVPVAEVGTSISEDFKLTPELLQDALSKDPSIEFVYLALINNPTAIPYGPEDLIRLQDVLLELHRGGRTVRLVVDTAYVGTGRQAADEPGLRALFGRREFQPLLISVHSFSKNLTLTGDRYGWVAFGDPLLAREMRSSWMNSVSTLPADWQLHFMAWHRRDRLFPHLRAKVSVLYSLRRDALRLRLAQVDPHGEIVAAVHGGEATIYVWVQLTPGHDCYSLFEKTGLAGIPGSVFGYGDDYVRLSIGTVPALAQPQQLVASSNDHVTDLHDEG